MLVCLVLIVHIVVAHVEIDHPVVFVCPCDRVIATVPYLVRLGSGADRITRWIDGQQNFNVGVGS